MGLFSKIGKFFKKIGKGIARGVKKVVGGVKKVFKKLGKSKILKALAIAAAVIVTGGAAIGAFAPAAAAQAGTFSAWMVNAGNAITGFTLGGTTAAGATTAFGTTAATTATGFGGLTTGVTGGLKLGSLLKPLATVGKFVGGTAGKATDFLKLTDPVTRGVQAPASLPGVTYDPYDTYSSTMSTTEYMKQQGVTPLTSAPAPAPPPVAGKTDWGDFLLRTGIQTGAGMLQGYLGQEDPRGELAGLASEGKDYQDALQIYAAQQGIDITNIYQNLAHGTGDPGYQVNAALYHQSAFQPVEAAYQPA